MNTEELLQEAIRLLKDLSDLQNGAPLEQHRKEWEETMEAVYKFLADHSNDATEK